MNQLIKEMLEYTLGEIDLFLKLYATLLFRGTLSTADDV